MKEREVSKEVLAIYKVEGYKVKNLTKGIDRVYSKGALDTYMPLLHVQA